LDAVVPVRAGTLWDGVHFEVPVGNAVAVWRLISFLFLVPAAGKHVSKTPLQEYRKGKGDFPVMRSQGAHSLSPRSKYDF